MSLLSENVIPGNYGKIFGTNALEIEDLEHIKYLISQIDGVKEVILNGDEFPREITVLTDSIVSVIEIEETVKKTGFNVIPKALFQL